MQKLYPVMLHSPSTSYIYHKDKYQCVRKVIDQLFCHFSRATDTRGVHKKRVTLKEICFRQISIDLIRFKSQKIHKYFRNTTSPNCVHKRYYYL